MSSIHPIRVAFLALALAACATDQSVVITHDTRFLSDTASPVPRPVPAVQRIVSARGIGGTTASPVSYDGEIGADGSVSFANVASLPIYVLVSYAAAATFPDAPGNVVGYPISSRRARIGDLHIGRPDVASTTMASTRVALHAAGLMPWDPRSSAVGLFSRSADVWAYVRSGSDPSEISAPMSGAVSLDGWTFGVESMNLPYGGTLPLFDSTRGDDLSIYRWDTTMVTATAAPWDEARVTRVTQYGSVDTAALSDGATTPLTATLASAGTAPFALDYRGSELLAVRAALGVPSEVGTDVYIALVHEGGTGTDYFNAVTPSVFELSASTSVVPDDAGCFPDTTGACDTVACPSGCNDATHLVEPGDFTLSVDTLAPFGVGRDVMLASVGWSQPWADGAGVDHAIDRRVILYRPAVSGQPIGVVLAPPLHIRIDGVEMPIVPGSASVASASPTITWDAPTRGTSGYYRVDIVAQRTFTSTTGETDSTRIVATFFTLEPALTVPAGILVAGADYSARVSANEATWDETRLGQPGGSNASVAYDASGVFHH